MADKNYIAANIARQRLNQQLPQEEFARRVGPVRQALEQGAHLTRACRRDSGTKS